MASSREQFDSSAVSIVEAHNAWLVEETARQEAAAQEAQAALEAAQAEEARLKAEEEARLAREEEARVTKLEADKALADEMRRRRGLRL